MTAAKWSRDEFSDGSALWYEYRLPNGTGYAVDVFPLCFRALFLTLDIDTPIDPLRKTLKAAHNDCKRHAKKLRAALVEFDRAKLP